MEYIVSRDAGLQNCKYEIYESTQWRGGFPIWRAMADMELLTISIPDKLIEMLESLPEQWNQVPAHNDSRLVGDAFVAEQRNLSLSVPSVVVPESRNYIINPMHPKMNQVKIVARRPFVFDGRI